MVLVSHDPHLIELVCDRLWLVDGGNCKNWGGDLDDYRKLLLDKQRSNSRSKRSSTAETPKNRKQIRQERAKARAKTAMKRKLVQEAEKLVEKFEQKKAGLEARLATPEVYDGPSQTLKELHIKIDEVKFKLAEAEDAWLKAHSEVEKVESDYK